MDRDPALLKKVGVAAVRLFHRVDKIHRNELTLVALALDPGEIQDSCFPTAG